MAAMNIRVIEDGAAERIKLAAEARGITLGEFMARLIALHEAMRARADAGDDGLQEEMKALGLETVQR
ncbi:MAG: hypothetical protein GEU73_06200 [Chloroflexi bacterium]|nr:hypothetical protein [Chloroflexota bacterium]